MSSEKLDREVPLPGDVLAIMQHLSGGPKTLVGVRRQGLTIRGRTVNNKTVITVAADVGGLVVKYWGPPS